MAEIQANSQNDISTRGITNANLANFRGKQRQVVINVDDGMRPIVMDGSTLGGKFKCASTEELSSGLAGKQPTGDYATNTALTEGLETKLNKSDKAESAKSADSILWSNIQNIPNNVSNALSYIEQTLTDEQKEQLVKNLDGTFLPLSGGTLTGQLSFPNGLSFSVGGSILSASTNGDFNWGGNKVERVIAFDSEKASEYVNRYVRFASGLQICYGFTLVKADQLYRKATFLAPFTEYSSVTLTPDSGAVDCVTTICGVDNTMVNIGRRRYTDSAYNFDLIVFYQVIGQWK